MCLHQCSGPNFGYCFHLVMHVKMNENISEIGSALSDPHTRGTEPEVDVICGAKVSSAAHSRRLASCLSARRAACAGDSARSMLAGNDEVERSCACGYQAIRGFRG